MAPNSGIQLPEKLPISDMRRNVLIALYQSAIEAQSVAAAKIFLDQTRDDEKAERWEEQIRQPLPNNWLKIQEPKTNPKPVKETRTQTAPRDRPPTTTEEWPAEEEYYNPSDLALLEKMGAILDIKNPQS